MRGGGLDETDLHRAVELEGRQPDIPAAFRPRLQNAILRGWAGDLTLAHEEMQSIRRHYIERGEDNEVIYAAFHSVLLEVWRADFTEASRVAEDAAEGLVASRRCGSSLLASWPAITLGFLDVSLGNYGSALHVLDPLLAALDTVGTEIFTAAFIPDAVEAMIQVGRIADAEPLVAALERNGHRLDRPWMLAVGARCRAMLLAAQGDIEGASAAAATAISEHARLSMPFERARTQLVAGQLYRRQRQRKAAAEILQEALAAFEEMGVPLWADRTRDELARAHAARIGGVDLTPSEQRVAELAASGMTNRGVAAALFLSPKTVEANLARIYRKLGIRSRAELGQRMSRAEEA
ncbi:MAG TPA: LuxR C-terminal-related transcriptional regulator [Mycobacterium sp.]|nr:LuxR C-terminal-related transcriptional regulator [Mycobacterium sp.]